MKSITVNSNKSHQYRCCQNKNHQLKCCQNKSHNTIRTKIERTQVVKYKWHLNRSHKSNIDRTEGITANANRTKVSRDPVRNTKIQQKMKSSNADRTKVVATTLNRKYMTTHDLSKVVDVSGATTFSITTLSIMTFTIMTISLMTQHNGLNCDTQHK